MDIKIITEREISDKVAELCIKACCNLPDDVVCALKAALARETNPAAKSILSQLIENQRMARELNRPCCQDTGMAVVFIDTGNAVVVDGDLTRAVNDGVRRAYTEGYLRKSVLTAISRKNTGDNTPAVIHLSTHVGSDMKIIVAPKGFGSENMSRIAMLKPSQGIEAALDFVVETVKIAGANPCPPVVVGVGIGGNFEECAYLAKKQLLRPLNDINPDPVLRGIEETLLSRINALNIGPMGLGGDTTALCVRVGEQHTHLAGFPVAVNMQCHACRHAEGYLGGRE